MIGVIFFFFLVVVLPDQEKPIMLREQMASLDECLEEVRLVTTKPPEILSRGGMLQASCVMEIPASVEH